MITGNSIQVTSTDSCRWTDDDKIVLEEEDLDNGTYYIGIHCPSGGTTLDLEVSLESNATLRLYPLISTTADVSWRQVVPVGAAVYNTAFHTAEKRRQSALLYSGGATVHTYLFGSFTECRVFKLMDWYSYCGRRMGGSYRHDYFLTARCW
jgi:hypothetical protein